MLTAKVKHLFFDSALVKSRVNAGVRKVLSKFGGLVRIDDRASMPDKAAGTQPAGHAPRKIKRTLWRSIFYSFDPQRNSVVIGAIPLPGGYADGAAALEEGGDVTENLHGHNVPMHISPHPHTHPAFERQKEKLPNLWANSVTN